MRQFASIIHFPSIGVYRCILSVYVCVCVCGCEYVYHLMSCYVYSAYEVSDFLVVGVLWRHI